MVVPVLAELRGRHVQGQRHVLARGVAGRAHRFEDHLDRLLVRAEIGSEASFVTHRGGEAAMAEHPLERREHLRPATHRLAQRPGAEGRDHELLEVHVVVGMGTAIDDVHQRHRHQEGAPFAQVAVEG